MNTNIQVRGNYLEITNATGQQSVTNVDAETVKSKDEVTTQAQRLDQTVRVLTFQLLPQLLFQILEALKIKKVT